MAPRIIGLTGKLESGKTTAARYLRERHGYEGSNLTDPMDEMLAPLLRRMKVPEHEIQPRLSGDMKGVPIPGYEWLTGRKLKQALGLEFRDAVSRPLPEGGTDRGLFHDLWVADNAHHERIVHEQIRYEFEARLIQRDGGVVYRIVNPDSTSTDEHESEKVDFEVDGEIINPRPTLDPLHAALDDVVGEEARADGEGVGGADREEPGIRIYRQRFSVEVMAAGSSAREVEVMLGSKTLEEILEDASGDAIIAGPVERDAVELVPPHRVHDELLAIGNDGTFFDYDLGLDGEPEDDDDPDA